MDNKRILVTGTSGFMGSHVADALEESGYKVILFDKFPSEYKTETQEEFIGDILIPAHIEKAVTGCYAIFHFAGQADIGSSRNSPTATIMSNVIGTQNILEAARKHNVNRFIFASTVYVYSDLGSFYRVSKQACEKIIEEYQMEFDLDYTILRFGSLYGPRANEFNGVQNYLIQAINNKKITSPGDGEQIREFIHVKDAALLTVNSLDEKYKNSNLIITGNQQYKVKDLLIMIKEILKGEIEIEIGQKEKLDHYNITPYNYRPNVAKRINPKTYIDLGQGLMEQIYELEMISKEKI